MQLVNLGDSALKRKRDKKDLLEESKSNIQSSPIDNASRSTDKKNREIPEARQLKFEEDEVLLKRLKIKTQK